MIVSEVWNSTPEPAITGGDHGRRPGRHHDAVGADPDAVVDDQLAGAGEAGVALEQRHPVQRGPGPAAVLRDLLDPGEGAVPDGRPVHPGHRGADAELGRVPDPAATSAVYTSILLGIQPRLMQVPPNRPASITATGPWPGSSGTTTFPDPEPMMAREKCCTFAC